MPKTTPLDQRPDEEQAAIRRYCSTPGNPIPPDLDTAPWEFTKAPIVGSLIAGLVLGAMTPADLAAIRASRRREQTRERVARSRKKAAREAPKGAVRRDYLATPKEHAELSRRLSELRGG